MISLFGKIFLILALFFSFLQTVLPFYGYKKNNIYLLASARSFCWLQFFCVIIAYFLLTFAFLNNDFSIAYVAANSHRTLPLMYKLTAVWGAHEGSVLLWLLWLNAWSVFFAVLQHQYKNRALVLAILGAISFCFLCFILLTSNPFTLALATQIPNDLNPLLQDPGFVIHPPMLYIGYVGVSVSFALTLAALVKGELDQTWARLTRLYTLAAWCFLTLGITLGSWWAYRVLGWGGFWFWDPVENASLLPWLSATALIHVLILVEKKQIGMAWAALLAIICFALSVLGTFLVRSGVLISAHTFANDPARGLFLLILLMIITSIALSIYVKRIFNLTKNSHTDFHLLSRESGLFLNSILLCVALATILLGTLYPLIIDALQLGSISVGAPYFNFVLLPQTFLVMFVMGLTAFLQWQFSPTSVLWREIISKFFLSVLAGSLITFFIANEMSMVSVLTFSLSIWILLSVFGNRRKLPGMSLAHAGFAIVIIGVMLSSTLALEKEVRIKPGNAVKLGPYQFFFLDIQGVQAENYRGIRGSFEVLKNARHVANLYPEKRIYTVREMVMTNVDIHPGIFRDLYIALGQPLDNDDWSVRIYIKPFIRFIWAGGIIMIVGGMLTLWQRKFYFGNAT